MSAPFILVLYYSRHGATEAMARTISDGIEQVEGMVAKVKTVPDLYHNEADMKQANIATKDDLLNCSGIILGSPTRFGNMAAPLKHFIDSTSDIWLSGGLVGKPAAAFTSSSTMHGGQETTIMTMLLPLLHHGAYIVGVPYSESALNETTTGGTPYGPSHVAGPHSNRSISPHEKKICMSLGLRVAKLSSKLITD